MGLNNIAHVTFLLVRKEDLSYDDFEKLYVEHTRKAVPILKKYGATYYTVVCFIYLIVFAVRSFVRPRT